VLWKKVAPKLSAGRVQSVATRIIVQRERDRMAFRSAAYWDVVAELDATVSDPRAQPPTFTARLTTSTDYGWPPAATSTRWVRCAEAAEPQKKS